MADTVIKQDTATAAEAKPERTFTQAEMDAIIGDRIARERAKYADYEQLKAKADQFTAQEEASKTDLQKAQDAAARLQKELDQLKNANKARDARDKVAAETGVPASLLTGETEEACKAQAAALLKWHGDQPNYPAARDGGEVQIAAGTKTRDQFADWFNANLNK